MAKIRIGLIAVLLVTGALSSVHAQEPEWALTETGEITGGGLADYNLDISYPTGWMTASQDSTVVFNELESDHQIALNGPFATEGYSISFVFQGRRDLRELGLPADDPTLEDLLAVNSQQYGYQDPTDVQETSFITWPALRVQTVDGMGNSVSVIQGFYAALGAYTFTLAAPSADSLEAFLPTWEAMLESVKINNGKVAFGDDLVLLSCSGEGSPTVILETSMGGQGSIWHTTQRRVSEFTRVCEHTFPTVKPDSFFTLHEYADNMHTLFNAAGISAPYVLVGPFAGGFFVREYTAQYPEDVAGMVLHDTFHPGWQERMQEFLSTVVTAEEADSVAQSERAMWATYGPMDLDAVIQEAAATGPFGDLPLVVLTPDAGGNWAVAPWTAETAQQWDRITIDELQPALATLSTNSTLVVVENATHMTMSDHPAVADAIQLIVEEIRAQGN